MGTEAFKAFWNNYPTTRDNIDGKFYPLVSDGMKVIMDSSLDPMAEVVKTTTQK